jgi:AraC family transcriptional regulator
MLFHKFPDLGWLKKEAESNFANKGWPNVVMNVRSGHVFRDNISGPLSFFSNVSGESFVAVDGRTTRIKEDHFFISNNSQRYTLEIKSAETFNIHVKADDVDFYNKLYPKDDLIRYLLSRLGLTDITTLEREELLTILFIHLRKIIRGEKVRVENIAASKLATRQEILRRLHLVTDHIYNNYDADISLDDLSKISMLSKFHFLRAFKAAFGMPPHKFLNQVRIEKAKDLLMNSKLDMMRVGNSIGIKDSSSFSRLFKKETGIYPTEGRRQKSGDRRQE